MPRKHGVQKAFCICGYHAAAVGELLAYKREPKNTIDVYCGAKDR